MLQSLLSKTGRVRLLLSTAVKLVCVLAHGTVPGVVVNMNCYKLFSLVVVMGTCDGVTCFFYFTLEALYYIGTFKHSSLLLGEVSCSSARWMPRALTILLLGAYVSFAFSLLPIKLFSIN